MAAGRLPRDLYAGVVAGELMHQGYFGQEKEYFGCAYWQEEKLAYIFSGDETEVYGKAAQLTEQGRIVSPVLNHLKRWEGAKKGGEMEKVLRVEMRQRLTDSFPEPLFGLLQRVSEVSSPNTGLSVLKSYGASLASDGSGQKQRAFGGLVQRAWLGKTIDGVNARALTEGLMEAEPLKGGGPEKRTFFGMAYVDEGGDWQVYSNAYLPAVIKRKVELTQNGRLSTPLFTESYGMRNEGLTNIGVLREGFEELLSRVFDGEYLRVLQELHNLPGVLGEGELGQEVKRLGSNLNPVSRGMLKRYAFLWRMGL